MYSGDDLRKKDRVRYEVNFMLGKTPCDGHGDFCLMYHFLKKFIKCIMSQYSFNSLFICL